jgi:hypothetical protein
MWGEEESAQNVGPDLNETAQPDRETRSQAMLNISIKTLISATPKSNRRRSFGGSTFANSALSFDPNRRKSLGLKG